MTFWSPMPNPEASISIAIVEKPLIGPKTMLRIALFRRLPDIAYESLLEIDGVLFPRSEGIIAELRSNPQYVNEVISSIDSAMQASSEGRKISYVFPLSDNRSRILLKARAKRNRLRAYLVDAPEDIREMWEQLS